jgi:hypothetical protein
MIFLAESYVLELFLAKKHDLSEKIHLSCGVAGVSADPAGYQQFLSVSVEEQKCTVRIFKFRLLSPNSKSKWKLKIFQLFSS